MKFATRSSGYNLDDRLSGITLRSRFPFRAFRCSLHVYFPLDNTLTEFHAIETDAGLVVAGYREEANPNTR